MNRLQFMLIKMIILIEAIILGFIGYYIYLTYNNWKLDSIIGEILGK